MSLKITYHGHSCFSLTYKGYTTVIDPYGSSVPGYLPLSLAANETLCSHEHSDHNCREAITQSPPTLRPYTVTSHVIPHDDKNGTLRGMNMIHIFQFDDLRVAHLGDIGCMPNEFLLNQLKHMDVIMIPVGGTYTLNAFQANELIKCLNPRITIPMHYRLDKFGFEVLEPLNVFSSICTNPTFYESNTILINKLNPPQTAILKF